MKKNLFKVIVMIFVYSSTGIAQPTLTASGINPIVGDVFVSHNCDYINPGSAGANQTWDLSAMTVVSTSTYTASDPSSTPYASSFTNSNLSINYGSENYFYNVSSTAFQNTGNASSGSVMLYVDPSDLLRFPFNINDTYTDLSGTSSSGPGWIRTATITVTYDGYGTLILPIGTYTNVGRVHSYSIYQDTYGSMITNNTNENYIWYMNGHHQAIASVNILTTSNYGVFSSCSYKPVTNTITTVKEQNALTPNIIIYPNPAINELYFYDSNDLKISEIQIYNIEGQLLLLNKLDHLISTNQSSINVQSLNTGIYLVKLILAEGNSITKKISINH